MTTLNLSLPSNVEERLKAVPENELHAYLEECLERLVVEQEAKKRLEQRHPILEEALKLQKTRETLSPREAGSRLSELVGALNEA